MKTYTSLCIIFFVYFMMLCFKAPEVFRYRFDDRLIYRYFLSQDIPYEVNGKRLFLSDSDIHIASGHLYFYGYDPSTINFQHPPLVKYLYGLSIYYFKNPLYVQVLFGMVLLASTYFMGKLFTGEDLVGFLAALLLTFDPILISLLKSALLDLGQAMFLILYVIFSFRKDSNFLATGILLGLAAGSKFWAGSLFMMLIVTGYMIHAKRFIPKNFAKQILITSTTFCMIYLPTFINHDGLFNILFFELKTVKYWFNHSVTSVPGASLILFLTSNFRSWWGERQWLQSETWSVLYPVSFVLSAINYRSFYATALILYLFLLGVQAPFTRYFIVILPFAYLAVSDFTVRLLIRPAGKNTG